MILQQDVQHELKRKGSFIELVFLAKHLAASTFQLAVHVQADGSMHKTCLLDQIKLFRRAVIAVLHHFGLGFLVLDGFDLVDCGVHRHCDGLAIGVCPASLHDARQHLCDFAARRPIRKAPDLARTL